MRGAPSYLTRKGQVQSSGRKEIESQFNFFNTQSIISRNVQTKCLKIQRGFADLWFLQQVNILPIKRILMQYSLY